MTTPNNAPEGPDTGFLMPPQPSAQLPTDWDPRHIAFQYLVIWVLNKTGINNCEQKLKEIAVQQDIEMAIQTLQQSFQNIFNLFMQYAKEGGWPADFWGKDPGGKGSGTGNDLLKQLKASFDKLFVKDDNYKIWNPDTKKFEATSEMNYYKVLLTNQGRDPSSVSSYMQVQNLLDSLDNKDLQFDAGGGPGAFIDAIKNFDMNDDAKRVKLQVAFNSASIHYWAYTHGTTPGQQGSNELQGVSGAAGLGAQYMSAQSTVHTTEMSMWSQQLSSYVDTGHRVEQITDEANKNTVNNYRVA